MSADGRAVGPARLLMRFRRADVRPILPDNEAPGLAIGLVQTVSRLFPQHADTVAAIVLGAVTLFETVGPLVAKAAFRLCGESEEARAAGASR